MNINKSTISAFVAAGTTVAMVTTLGAGVAHAEPIPATPERAIAMVGSETTTPVMNALSNDADALALGGVLQVANFNATGTAQINTHPSLLTGTAPTCLINRPNGSTEGRLALLASQQAGTGGNGCIQGARSSSGASTSATNPALVYIPFARESITYAITNTSNFPKKMSLATLQSVFKCEAGNNGTGATFSHGKNYEAMLPQDGSGTRSYWIGQMGYDTSTSTTGSLQPTGQPSLYPCVQNGVSRNPAGGDIQEHNGSQVNNSEIVPFSVAQWTSQASGVIGTDVRGATRLGQLINTSAKDFNPFAANFPLQRNVFNVFPADYIDGTAAVGGSAIEQLRFKIQTLFKGSGSQLCTGASATDIILRFGFRAPVASNGTTLNCGDTTARTPQATT